MQIDVATPAQIRQVALHMRDHDIAEFSALSPFDTREEIADGLVKNYGGRREVLCASFEGAPVVIGGMICWRPNVRSLLCFGTDAFSFVGVSLTRFITQRLFPAVKEAGCHRIEAVSIAGYEDMHRWIEALGLHKEAEMPNYGKGRETFLSFAWTA